MRARRQRGMAVIGALVVVAAASLATTSILERQSMLADTLAAERDRAQARWLLRGGVDWARIILFNDARVNAVTLKDAIWAQPITGLQLRAPGQARSALFSGVIEDEQGKYNLARVADGGALQARELAVLGNLLQTLGMPSGLSGAIARRVADAQPSPHRPPAAPGLRSVHDLVGVDGMTRDAVAVLSEYLTILPADTTINVNTASAEVLSAAIKGLDLGKARSLTQARDRGLWFNSRGDFLNRLGDPDIPLAELKIDVRSDWFKVSGEVSLDHARAGMRALLHRQGSAPPAIRWIEG